MNKLKYIFLSALFSGILFSCSQETVDTVTVLPQTPETPSGESGSADFSNFVALGNSLTAGVQGNAVFRSSQENSMAAIINRQLALAGGSATFNQPTINSDVGFTGFAPDGVTPLGRLVLQTNASGSTLPAPLVPGELPQPYTGDPTQLNNFGVPGILLGQALIPQTGGPNVPENPAFNSFYARFASNPGVSTIIGDALATQPTFFMFALGNNDVLGYAVNGGDASRVPMTDPAAFQFQYEQAIGAFITTYPDIKGVVAEIPNVLVVPFFNLVPYNAIPFTNADQGTIDLLNGPTAYGGYNQIVQAAAANGFISADEAGARQISFAVGANPVVVSDEDLTDLGGFFDFLTTLPPEVGGIDAATRAGLEPLRQARQAVAGERMPLPMASVLGTLADPNNPLSVIGVGVPLRDHQFLTANEQAGILDRINTFNDIINGVAGAFGGAVAVANTGTLTTEIAAGPQNIDGVVVTPDFAPPSGFYSADGVHPNARGYAIAANKFIEAINETFGASVPLVDVASYPSLELPIPAN